ncbi:MAG TPA: alpha/beta fold hydrolase [Rhizomicrobium sp.]|jgi:dipeptidyl aminopeptidase/acylaminoacyl peptidase
MRFSVCAAALAVAATLSSAAAANPPVEAFGDLPLLSSPQLAPDGKHFAAIEQLEGRPTVVIYPVNAPEARPVIVPSPKAIITGAFWINSDRLLVTVKANLKEAGERLETWSRAFVMNADGSNVQMLLKGSGSLGLNYDGNAVLSEDATNPNLIYVELWVWAEAYNEFHLDLYRVDVGNGDREIIARGTHDTGQWLMDGKGHVVARIDETHRPLVDHLMVADGDNWREVAHFDASAGGEASVLGMSEDGQSLIVQRNLTGHDALYPLNIATGKYGDALYSNPSYDAATPIYDDQSGRIVGVVYTADKTEFRYFDPAREALQLGLEQAFPGQSVAAASYDTTRNIVIAETNDPKKGINYYYLDRTTHRADPIASAYPKLQETDLGEMKSFSYKARDGRDIPAYLTLPPGRQPKNLPLVVFPHGGPQSRDVRGFDWWAQFMANRGYAVFQPNYRGSSGYGSAFREAGYHQWGLKMQDDITDGVHKLIADGTVDAKRICIVGASYGGYAALAGAAFTPDLYRCAVSVAGVTDLRRMLATDLENADSSSAAVSYWNSRLGNRYDDETQLDAVSPALHADKIKIPVLLMHGTGDTTVRIAQSEEMQDALERAGNKPVFIQFDGDDHNLEFGPTRNRMLSEIEKFLKANIGN